MADGVTSAHLAKLAGDAIDAISEWAERVAGDPNADPAALASEGAEILEGIARSLRGDAEKARDEDDRGPAFNDALDMSEAAKRRAAGRPVKNTFVRATPRQTPRTPSEIWPADMSADLAARRRAAKPKGR